MRKPAGKQVEAQQCGKQRLHARVPEAQARSALAVDLRRTVQRSERLGSDGAVVAEALDAEQASVGSKADLLQIIEVLQPAADIEVIRVVDDRLGAQRATLLVVLLDARVLVVHMQRRDDPVGNDAGAIPRGGASADAPVEDQLHVVGSPHVEVLAHHLLEEDPSGHRPVEDLGAREFSGDAPDAVELELM